MIKKLFITLSFASLSTYAQEVAIAKASVESLPDSYSDYLTEFLVNNVSGASLLTKGKEPLYVVYPSLIWEGKAYNLCIKTYKANNPYSSSCITVNYAEDIYSRLKTLQNNEFFKLKDIPEKKINIKLQLNTNPQYNKVKLVSQKGDNLTRYVDITKDIDGVKVGKGFVNLNVITLDDEAAGKVFKLLIENNKIEKVVVE
ncbi:hypothetical protein SULAZ_0082 [Sulfurihydrogenibium azorense Az-Fu1]|uniref:Uncharacterized protein n=1 Tax=Sulfurihydrogenibium azorense (strain DSM 15241 / OCM 825 / Az-Fu1) TaxID=204536 RepID=C1DXG7_SULAA|nr:hypothetical protein [Sulfurihydrogenibium azorense]ACN98878.1 hypothetical protein SULAZ_0082 [Sulfurihydrogenibium azorense Az-Fu1]